MTDNESQSNGPGRPTELVDGKRLNIYLDGNAMEVASRLGNGNLSLGIRLALDSSEPLTTASKIKRIGDLHIRLNADLFLDDLEEAINGLAAGKQDRVLENLELDEPKLIENLRQRNSFELAASNAGFELYDIWDDEYIVTSYDEVKKYLTKIGGKLREDGAYHIELPNFEVYSGTEFEDALEEWLRHEQGFCEVRSTPEEAWQDACARHSIPPVVLKPVIHFIVSDVLAAELEKQGEIVSTKLIGGFRVWACLDRVDRASGFDDVHVLKKIARSQEACNKLLGTPKKT